MLGWPQWRSLLSMESPGVDARRASRAVGGYQLLQVLGSGGMGTVYLAIDAEGNHVALKLLHPAFNADDGARERLRREVATLHRVRGPRVSRVLDAEVDADEAFVVTELINGQPLDTSIREHGPMDAEELRGLAVGLAAALDQIHGVNVVHRDLKPGNVMLTDAGPVVIDFGISQLADDARLTQAGLVTGTPGYVDPVVLAGGVPGTAGDWWGWAAVLLFAATGRPPFGSGPMAAVLARVETGRADTDGLPPRIAQVMRRALHPDPTLRMPHGSVLQAMNDRLYGREVTEVVDPNQHTSGSPAAPQAVAAGPPPPPPVPQSGPPVPAGPTLVRPPDAPPAQRQWHPPPTPAAVVEQPGRVPAPQAQPMPPWAVPARSRPSLSLAWWLAVVAVGTLWPGWTVLIFAAVLAIAGTVGASARALRNRRLRHGPRRSDIAVASLASPWHVLLAILLLLPGALLGLLGGAIVWGLLAASVQPWIVVLVALAVTTQLVWWTPSGQTTREGAWAVWEVIAPGPVITAIWILVGLIVAAVAGAAVVAGPEPVWWPLPVPPVPSFVS